MSFLDRLSLSYAAVPLRLGVGIVFLIHGISKVKTGLNGVAAFFGTISIPMPTVGAGIVMALETVGAVFIILGIFTRWVAAALVVEMLVAILFARLPGGRGFELEGLLLAGALSLVILGDGAWSVAGLKRT